MKMTKTKAILLSGFMMLGLHAMATNEESKNNEAPDRNKVVVIGLDDNVKSNYYTPLLLSEKTDISADSVCCTYNKIVEQNFARSGKGVNFVCVDNGMQTPLWKAVADRIQVEGTDQHVTSSLSGVSAEEYRRAMQNERANYLLVIDGHFLDYREKPMQMMYHYINYSLYDINEKKISSGQCYFPAYEPQSKNQLASSSMKSIRKVANDLYKLIGR